jgi:hypothetical protein
MSNILTYGLGAGSQVNYVEELFATIDLESTDLSVSWVDEVLNALVQDDTKSVAITEDTLNVLLEEESSLVVSDVTPSAPIISPFDNTFDHTFDHTFQ